MTAWIELESIMLSKPGSEGQIPYDLMFKWNLINKTNKQANITRDIEIKNNLKVIRGEMEGDNVGRRGRFSGTTIKDTWTKPRGEWKQGREEGLTRVLGGVVGSKRRQL